MAEETFLQTAVLSSLTTTVGHGLWSGIAGYFYGLRASRPAATTLWKGVLLAIVAHAAFGTAAFIRDIDALVPVDLLAAVLVLVATAVAYFALLERTVLRITTTSQQEERFVCPTCGSSAAPDPEEGRSIS